MDDINLKEILNEYYEPELDDYSKASLDDTRRPRLTLRHLNKLRKVRELRKLEKESHDEFVQQMYGSSGDDDGGVPEF